MTIATGSNAYAAIGEMNPSAPKTAPTAPSLHKIREVSADPRTEYTTVQSASLLKNRTTAPYFNDGKSIMVDLGYELHNYATGSTDPIFKSVLFSGDQSDIDTTNGVSVDIEGAVITASGSTINLSGATVTPDNITDYQKVKITGTANNDGIYTLVNSTGDTYTATPAFSADETVSSGATMKGKMIRNSNTYLPLIIEEGHSDISEYEYFLGLVCDTFNIEIGENGIINSTSTLIGLEDSTVSSTPYPDATYTTTSDDNNSFRSSEGMKVYIDDVDQFGICRFKSGSISLTNSISTLEGAGKFGPCATTSGALAVSTNFVLYFTDSTYKDKYRDETKFSVAFDWEDNEGTVMSITLPQLKVTSSSSPIATIEEMEETISCDAETASSTSNCKIQIDIFPA